MACRSYLDQTLSYFNDRPHTGAPTAPRGGVAAWQADDFGGPGDGRCSSPWRSATSSPPRVGPWWPAAADLGGLASAEQGPPFPSSPPWWRPRGPSSPTDGASPCGAWLPGARAGPRRVRGGLLGRGLGLHLGLPGAQNGEGDLLGHVTDYHDPPGAPLAREYRSTVDIDFHCDAAMWWLSCVATRGQGGASRLVSSVAAFDEAAGRRPPPRGPAARDLRQLDTRSDGEGFADVPSGRASTGAPAPSCTRATCARWPLPRHPR